MSRFFVNRPTVAMVLSILLVLGGALSAATLPVAQYPEVVPPQIQVSASYTGADALTVEKAVATPIEQQMNGVERMLYMQSVNSNEGVMTLTVTFDVESDIDLDNILVQNRLSQAQPFLPPEVRASGVTVRKAQSSPLLLISLSAPGGQYDASFLANYAVINLNDVLLRVPGVGQVANYGAANYAMRIWVRPDQLALRGLTVTDLAKAIQAQNVVNPAGQVGAEPAPPGQERTLTARAQGRLETPEEFGEIVVRATPEGAVVRLKDVARIELGTQTYAQIARLDGKPATLLGVFATPGSNALEVAAGVKRAMEEQKASFPPGLEYTVSLDTTLPITEGLREIIETLLIAVVLVILVVFLFLQSPRATLIPLLTVPVSLLGAFLFFPLFGFSINTLSLLGLVLAIGLVVDDAIVVVEAVMHHIEEGMTPRDATLKAMEEVGGAVVGIALILSAVFIPMAFVAGITGRMYQQFALTIALSVLISAFNALSLSPALSALLLRPTGQARRGPLGRFFDAFERGFKRTTDGYVSLTARLVRKAALSLGVLGAVMVAVWLLGARLPGSFIPEEDLGYLFVDAQLPDAASLQRTDALAKQVEAILEETHGVEAVNTVVGYSLLSQVGSPSSAFFFVALEPWEERGSRELGAKGIAQALNAKFAALPQARVLAFLPPSIPGIGTSGGFSLMLQDRSGGTPQFLAQQVERFLQEAGKRPEIGRATSPFRASVPQVFMDVDREQVLKQGIPLSDVYQALAAFLGGIYINDFNRFGRQWRVYLQAEPEARVSTEGVSLFFVRNAAGGMVPLSAVLEPKPATGPAFTTRFNLFRAAEVTGGAAPGYSSGQAMQALEEVAAQVLPREMGYAWSGLSYQQKHAAPVGPTFTLALLAVFLLLAALYESWSLPFSVLLVVPVAVLGAFVGLLMRDFPLDVFSQVGLVMLVGLAAKNAILIVEFAKLQRERGRELEEAALEAARLRLRPILMTSFAFILGCVPLWVAGGAGAVARRELGTTVIVGMTVVTLLGVFLTPAYFVVVEGFNAWRAKRRWLRQTRRGGEAGPPPGAHAHPAGGHSAGEGASPDGEGHPPAPGGGP